MQRFFSDFCSLLNQGDIDPVYYTPLRFGPKMMPNDELNNNFIA